MEGSYSHANSTSNLVAADPCCHKPLNLLDSLRRKFDASAPSGRAGIRHRHGCTRGSRPVVVVCMFRQCKQRASNRAMTAARNSQLFLRRSRGQAELILRQPESSDGSSRLFPRSTRFLICWSLSGVNFICLPRVGSCLASSSVCIIFVSREQLLRLTPPAGQSRRPEVFRLVARGVS